MKVLFAVGNAALSENIAKKYLELFGEKIEYKDVFYFKAILEEVKRDKSYDRIVIAEQLEPIHNNVIAEIDKMLFNNIDSITDEIDDTAIIFICSENRTRNDSLLGRFYNIGLYNVLTGDERQVPNLCRLIKEPRGKKEAKEYLKGNVGVENVVIGQDEGVNENELFSICRYFDNLRSPEEYINAFEDVVGQYEDEDQLQTIVAALTTQLKRGDEIFDALNSEPRFQRYCAWRGVEPQEPVVEEKKSGGLFHNILGNIKSGKNTASSNMRENINHRKNGAVNEVEEPIKGPKTEGYGVGAKIAGLATGIQKEDNSAQLREEAEKRQREQERIRQQQMEALKAKEEELKRQEAELIKKQEEEKRIREEKFKQQQEAYQKAQQEELIRKQQEELIKKQQEEAVIKAQQEAALKAQQEAQLKAQQEAQIKAQQEAALKAQQEAQLQAQQEEQLRAQEEARIKAEQEAAIKAQQEAALKAQQEAQLKAQEEARIKAEQEAALKAQQEAKLKAQEEARRKAEEEAKLKAQEEARIKAEQEAALRAQQEAKLKAQQEELRRQQQEAQFNAQQEELRRQQEELRRQQEELAKGIGVGAAVGGVAAGVAAGGIGGYSTPASNLNDADAEDDAPTSYTGRILQVPPDYKKVVAVVGTNKIGTSFIVNSVGTLLALKGVKVSILDMTKNRGLYWYYSDDTYKKNDVIATCMSNLSNGVANPISIGRAKNLNLYTTIPMGREDNRKGYKHRTLVETAKRNCNLLIIDCDFTTPFEYLEFADEIYIVQDLDIVKSRETVEYLRLLRDRRIEWDKLRLIFNNTVRCKITSKMIRRDALTLYRDPNGTFNDEVDEIRKFVELPLDPLNYATYIEGMEHGKLAYDKYTEPLKASLETLSKMVYGVPSRRKGIFGG